MTLNVGQVIEALKRFDPEASLEMLVHNTAENKAYGEYVKATVDAVGHPDGNNPDKTVVLIGF